jgi:cobaltochelatase CobN
MRLVSIMWDSHCSTLKRAGKALEGIMDVGIYSSRRIEEEPEKMESALKEAETADAILLYRSTESIWEMMEKRLTEIGKDVPIVCVGHDPSYWALSTVKTEIVVNVYTYITYNGEENFSAMLRYIAWKVCGMDIEAPPPQPIPWEGLYHPDAPDIFSNVEEYLTWYASYKKKLHLSKATGTVGLLLSRFYWVNKNFAIEDALIKKLEALGLDVIPAFSYSVKDENLGTKGSGEVVLAYFMGNDGTSRIDALISLQSFLLGTNQTNVGSGKVASDGIRILKKLDIPVFTPITSYYKTIDEWRDDPQGADGSSIGWSIAMPEFEGRIEPIIIGGLSERDGDLKLRAPIDERIGKLARRALNWIRLQQRPVNERKVAFILHNNPCASVEATVGSGAHLDTLESVAGIMHRMKEVGYDVVPPKDGKELIETIMNRKAISEFRWTTTEEIVEKGGVLKMVSKEEYEKWFNTLSESVRKRMCDAWGNPPGEEKDGIPAAMVHEGKILVTGISCGNAVVCIQPKRGCAGARCDGRVCKILHDPDIPPPHQYMATYRYLERDFGVDVIVHVGTHGNLEFLPGKGTALSAECYPDIGIGDIPHLYIYNADNPPEGTIAKRRSYATLVDHMQTVMMQGGLYEELEELNRFLGEYEQVKNMVPARAHALEHLIMEAIKKTNLDKEIKLTEDMPFDEIARRAHGALSRTRNTQIQDGMHIFGELPEGEKKVDFINSILRYDAGNEISLRKIVASMMGMNLSEMLSDGGKICPLHKRSYGELLEEVNEICKSFIKEFLNGNGQEIKDIACEILGDRLKNGKSLKGFARVKERIFDLARRIEKSQEIKSLLHGFDGSYITAGPSGLITRGRDDVLPTGRNFYSLDPYRIPTKAAWEVGQKLAEAVMEKHLKEEDRYPENIAIFWMCSDIMWADGEGMAQIMYLLGVKPTWLSNGRVRRFEVIPVNELGRPRIDVTIRVSGITRDNFPNCIELIDEAVQAVASLDEPVEMNYVRKHTLAQMGDNDPSSKEAWRDATLRIFASKPGTYQAGTQLAVYASAWKEEKDLSDVFIYWNGYAYGKGIFGKEKHRQFMENLKTVEVTYNKVVTDEYDLFGCCCYFGTHGGMTAAARTLSGKEVHTYYGDTREPEHVEVRDLADEIRRVGRTKLLNPKWIEGMKRHGYKGAGDISKRIGRVYGWEATTQEVDDWIFDDIARTFMMNEENKKFFEENNPWALEEIARRLIEAVERGLWNPAPDVKEALKEIYVEIEGWIEEKMGDVKGDFQGGSIDIITKEEVETWKKKMEDILK